MHRPLQGADGLKLFTLRRVAFVAAFASIFLLPTGVLATDPSNNSVLDAITMRSNPFSHSVSTKEATIGYTNGVAEPRPCGRIGKTVWYRLWVAEGQKFTANTFGSNFDTVIAMYRAPEGLTSFSELELIGCNDDAPGSTQSRLKTTVNAGDSTFIYVQVGGYHKAGGTLSFNFRAKPLNDSIFGARLISEIYFHSPINTALATKEADESAACAPIGRTVWYAYYVPQDMVLVAKTFGSNFDTVLAVYSENSPWPGRYGDLTAKGCNDNWSGTASAVTFSAYAGETIYVQVGGYDGASGDLAFSFYEYGS